MSNPPIRPIRALGAIVAAALLSPVVAVAASPAGAREPDEQCRAAIVQAEREFRIPGQLLHAIARVESGRRDANGRISPWPWTINAEGEGKFFQTREEAVAHVRQLQARGVRLIDVGCMQINLHHHPRAFSSLEEAFDPLANARYAARFLRDLHASRRDWLLAATGYHSSTPEFAEAYRVRVLAAWPVEQRRAAGVRDDVIQAWTATSRAQRGARALAQAQVSGFQSVALSLSNRADRAQVIPLGTGRGRGLESYRSAPIATTSRPMFMVGMAESRGR